ncbi:protein PSK SIMULATOR 3-like [Oryza glaberrima]|nr:protein PSK SIMULATOR 3-like [Oryza glaberrima]
MPMAIESWLTKVRSAIISSKPSPSSSSSSSWRSKTVGILALEVATLMSKLVHLWRSLADAALARLRHHLINLDGVRKLVSHHDAALLALACAELTDALRVAAHSVAALATRCADPFLRDFADAFADFADTGRDPHRWVSTWKDMDSRAHKMDKQVAATSALRTAMEDLADAEHGLRKLLQTSSSRRLSATNISLAAEQQQLIFAKKQEVKHLKQTSLWSSTFDAVVSSLARAAFTILARIKLVFGAAHDHRPTTTPLHRSLTLSSAVHPSSVDVQVQPPVSRKSMSMDMGMGEALYLERQRQSGLLERSAAALVPPPGTLGAAALAPRYAWVIISIERMARSPRLVGAEERDELYGMLTASVRAQLRARLRGTVAAAEPGLAGQWRAAVGGILEWLAPMAHATVRWQAERSLEQQRKTTREMETQTLVVQTLQMAERGKVEAAVAELLVGLNYLCRFHKEITTCRTRTCHHDDAP